MNSFNLIIEGPDRVGKDYLRKYIDHETNYVVGVLTRTDISNAVYERLYRKHIINDEFSRLYNIHKMLCNQMYDTSNVYVVYMFSSDLSIIEKRLEDENSKLTIEDIAEQQKEFQSFLVINHIPCINLDIAVYKTPEEQYKYILQRIELDPSNTHRIGIFDNELDIVKNLISYQNIVEVNSKYGKSYKQIVDYKMVLSYTKNIQLCINDLGTEYFSFYEKNFKSILGKYTSTGLNNRRIYINFTSTPNNDLHCISSLHIQNSNGVNTAIVTFRSSDVDKLKEDMSFIYKLLYMSDINIDRVIVNFNNIHCKADEQ